VAEKLFEAAGDGATRLKKIRYITLPSIKPTMTLLILTLKWSALALIVHIIGNAASVSILMYSLLAESV
jgi:ABC-type polysaccharide transport system permease subunit